MIVGITVLPARLTRFAPAGTWTAGGGAGLRDPRAVDDQRRVLDHAPVADDDARAFIRGGGLPGRRSRTAAESAERRIGTATTYGDIAASLGCVII